MTSPAARGPGLKDVAALAGVSHQTVSRVLNTPAQVRRETQTRVMSAIKELGYHPNSAARTLVTGRSRRLGVVLSHGTLYGPSSVLHGVEQAALAAGFFVSAVSLRSPSWTALKEAMNHLVDQGVEGIVVTTPLAGADQLSVLAPLPVIAVQAGNGGDVTTVDTDQVHGARAATEHLLGLGHPTVWHVAGPDGWQVSSDRIAGWCDALAAASSPVPPVLQGDWTARSGYEAGLDLARDRNCSAVFVGNDQMAIGLLRAMRQNGRRVPEEVSVVGFDDIPEAAYLAPPLTTIRQNYRELGSHCLRLLLQQIKDPGCSAYHQLLDADLVIRDSTAAAS